MSSTNQIRLPHTSAFCKDVNQAIAFSGISHDFFLREKAHIVAKVSQQLPQDGFKTVLDLGCGVGLLTEYTEAIPNVMMYGCDIMPPLLDEAKARCPKTEFRSSSITRLPYPDHSFDLVYFSCVMHHVYREDRCVFLKELKRVLKPNAPFIMFEHNPYNPLTRLVVSRCAMDRDAQLVAPAEAEKMFSKVGFMTEKVRHFLHMPIGKKTSRIFDGIFGRLPLGAQYYTICRAAPQEERSQQLAA